MLSWRLEGRNKIGMPSLLDRLMNIEKDESVGLLIRYNPGISPNEGISSLNKKECSVIGINKDDNEHILILSFAENRLQLSVRYEEEINSYLLISITKYNVNSDNCVIIGKTAQYDFTATLIVQPVGKKYIARNAEDFTTQVCVEIAKLRSYDSVIEEERRKEEEKKQIDEQLDLWKYCIEAELKLLVDTPFFCNGVPTITKKRNYEFVDLPIAPYVEESGEHTKESIRTILQDDSLEPSADGSYDLTYAQIMGLMADNTFAIQSIENCQITIGCDASHYANSFKKQFRGRYILRYEYDWDNNSVEFLCSNIKVSRIEQLIKDINNSLYFSNTISEADVLCHGVRIVSRREETKPERKRREELLNGKEMLTDNDTLIGTLRFEGSDYSQIRIVLPKDEEAAKTARNRLSHFIEKGKYPKYIKPDVRKERAILSRENDAVRKVQKGVELKSEHLREFIFNSSKARPTAQFENNTIEETQNFKECKSTSLLHLNASQQKAVTKALYAQDLCLLQGPPGTGKTTVIAELLWQHIRTNQDVRIMLTSQTNLAIDNALSRLFSEFASTRATDMLRYKTLIKPLRIADSDKLSDEGMPFTSDRINSWVENDSEEDRRQNVVYYWMVNISNRINLDGNDDEEVLREWKESLVMPDQAMRQTFAEAYKASYNIMGMTCGKVDSNDFKNNRGREGFDVVIMDEASKCTPPELIMPLCYARKAIVIGDHRQLPPVMYAKDFQDKLESLGSERASFLASHLNPEMVETSLFKRLITNEAISPTIKATFNEQYRMHPQINEVIEQFYADDSGGLHCGLSPAKVDINNFSERESRYHGFLFPNVIDPHKHVLWIDVAGSSEGRDGESWYNDEEVKAVESFIIALVNSIGYKEYFDYWHNYNNVEASNTEGQIGVISFYSAQVDRLRRKMQSLRARFEVFSRADSVDNFQGQERGIVIVSTVRTNGHGGFTRSPERLNVALSRARRLLVIVGDSQFFGSVRDKDGKYIYRNVIEKIKANGGFINYKDLEMFSV